MTSGAAAAAAEAVFGEFKSFELADADLLSSRNAHNQLGSRGRRALRRKQRLQRQFVPEVLRSDVFGDASATGGGLVTSHQIMTSSVEREMLDIEDEEEEVDESTFHRSSPPTVYGAVDQQPT